MPHLVMIEIAKLPKERRERVIRLCDQNLCLCCERRKQHARGRCSTCLNEFYGPLRFLSPIDAAKLEAKCIRAGTILTRYDRSARMRRMLKSQRAVQHGKEAIDHDRPGGTSGDGSGESSAQRAAAS